MSVTYLSVCVYFNVADVSTMICNSLAMKNTIVVSTRVYILHTLLLYTCTRHINIKIIVVKAMS